MPTQPKPIILDNLNLGGMSDSKYSGIEHSWYKLVGLDLHSEPGSVSVRQKLAKNSGSTVDALCKVVVECSDGNKYWFSFTSGKVFKDASGTWSLAHTTTPEVGGAGCLGACEYEGYIYWATEKRLHRIKVSATSDWSTGAEEDWSPLNLDQEELGGTGSTYSLTTGVNEGATHRQSFAPLNSPIEAIAVNIDTVGTTADWTVKVHDSSNTEVGSATITNANLVAGWNIFTLSAVFYPTLGNTYHIHVYASNTTGTPDVKTEVSSDLEGGNVRVYTTSDSEFHPMFVLNLVLYIGDKHFVHQVEKQEDNSHLFSREAVDFEQPFRVKCLTKYNTELLAGTIINSSIAIGRVYRWNTYAVSFTSSDDVEEVGINAFLDADNMTLVSCGLAGNIYYYDGEKLEFYKKIGGTYNPSNTATIHPNAVGNLQGMILFGMSQVTGTPVEMGVYALFRYDRKYPWVHDLSFPISERSGGALVTSGIEIGAILTSGHDLYVSWKNGSSYGVDKLDYSNKLELAYGETRLIIPDRKFKQNFQDFTIAYSSLPSSTAIGLAYDSNHTGSYTSFAGTELLDDTDRKLYQSEGMTIQANVLQLKLSFTVSSNNSPKFEGLSFMPN